MNHKKLNSAFDNIALIIIAYVAVTRVWLAFASLDYLPAFYYFNQAMNYLCIIAGTVLIFKYRISMTKEKLMLIFLSAIYPFFCFFYTVNGDNKITALFSLLSCIIFFVLPGSYQVKIFDLFYKIVFYTSLISCVLYFLYLIGINIGFSLVPYYAGFQNAYYVKWFVFAIYKSSTELRLCGIFNEPGGLGTVCALLFIARYEYMKKHEKIIMLITILLTFSLAGFILIFGYYAFRIVSKNPQNIIFIFVFAAVFLVLPYINFGNEQINSFFDRISITKTGLAGDNRTKEWFDEAYDDFMKTSDKWFGRKEGYTFPTDYGGNLSYKTYIVEYGIIGFLLWMIAWLHCGIKISEKNKNCILLIIFFLISLYQRPSPITGLYGFVLLFGGIKWLKVNSEMLKKAIRNVDPISKEGKYNAKNKGNYKKTIDAVRNFRT